VQPPVISAVVEEATALAMIGAGHQGVRLSLEFDPEARVAVISRIQIQQVLVNLVRNAVEAMAESVRRKFSISTRALGDGAVELVIADTLAGAPARDRTIFRFTLPLDTGPA
jgi:two-component system sensor kinase FixL